MKHLKTYEVNKQYHNDTSFSDKELSDIESQINTGRNGGYGSGVRAPVFPDFMLTVTTDGKELLFEFS